LAPVGIVMIKHIAVEGPEEDSFKDIPYKINNNRNEHKLKNILHNNFYLDSEFED